MSILSRKFRLKHFYFDDIFSTGRSSLTIGIMNLGKHPQNVVVYYDLLAELANEDAPFIRYKPTRDSLSPGRLLLYARLID